MKVLVVRETMPGERRVAATPETVAKMVAAGLEVTVEAGAGEEASFPDAAFEAAGAKVVREHAKALAAADIVLRVQPPADGDVKAMRKGALSIGFLQPATSAAAVKALAKHGVTAFSLEMVPRISPMMLTEGVSKLSDRMRMSTVWPSVRKSASAARCTSSTGTEVES